ncbi:hypothetical protein MCHIJ_27640 [Mycolicibacterium chitae]|nr:hypothetical protein MCHIJ_27640 [Mycolicibacterium chitae]
MRGTESVCTAPQLREGRRIGVSCRNCLALTATVHLEVQSIWDSDHVEFGGCGALRLALVVSRPWPVLIRAFYRLGRTATCRMAPQPISWGMPCPPNREADHLADVRLRLDAMWRGPRGRCAA